MIRSLTLMTLLLSGSTPLFATEIIPAADTVLSQADCINCHQKTDSQIITDWQSSTHATTTPITDCVSCHGNQHQSMAGKARKNTTCNHCHDKKQPATHSYQTSKHGILMTLETEDYDWSQPLENANYRSPGCSYCHMHRGQHLMLSLDALFIPCQDCHAPRYLAKLVTNGEKMYSIATMKVHEANDLVAQAAIDFGKEKVTGSKDLLELMQQHLRNVRLGIGHQSPDYQWWHGQPALDGDLLRIKGIIGEVKRQTEIDKIQHSVNQPQTHQ